MGITSKLPVSLKNFENVIISILVEFVCNAKSFAIAVLVSFLLLFFPLAFLKELPKFLLINCYPGSIRKSENRKKDGWWHRRFKAQKKREIDLISRSLKKNEKDVQKKKLIDIEGESNIATVSEELVSSENIARCVWVATF